MSTRSTPSRSRASLQGFTLIEVLIAILVFSLGLLGTVGLQARVAQMASQNGDRSRAAVLANEMVSSLWANQSSVPQTPFYSTWQTAVASPTLSGLPNGSGSVAACSSGQVGCAVVTVQWQGPYSKTGAQANSYTTTVVIQ